jgi:hypothetical protein
MTHRDDPRDPATEEAMEEQRQGSSDGQMARYGVRVLPPRDHRHGWDHPYSRPGGPSGKAGGKSGKSGERSGKGGIHRGKGGDHRSSNSSSSSNRGQGAGTSPYPSREREQATRRIQRLQVSKWDRSPNPGDTSGEEPEEEPKVTVIPLSEGQHTFLSSVWDRYQAGETQ